MSVVGLAVFSYHRHISVYQHIVDIDVQPDRFKVLEDE